ncbi:SusC/RagA family TonB-linked outer membrane protein [Polaribacter ponticola]|uniref:TonB-dependent receptor n=1 Tax=Polaribacter ponticola TaxID=2978475 RepID=A0ABT5S9R0_9FLAO|nr:TonB-dependent receptor [Polaribacter sp. MSW5]MDD7914845.1 TonB-dependent receptor [Polaribacter sp. MSW5]
MMQKKLHFNYLFQAKHLLLLAFFFFGTISSFGQDVLIKGTVLDKSNNPIPGVAVIVKGNSLKGTETDFDGKFSIKVLKTEKVLVFSYLGYKKREINIDNQTTITVILEEDSESLDEIIVVGYGTQKKSDVTGAVGRVKSEELNKVAVSNPTEALQGRVAGVTVVKSSGSPGSEVDIKIRGVGTNGNNQPLYIVDGVQANSYFIDPNNIASIEILKDVSSAAIYGTRAANGVVIITTKKGRVGDVKVEFDSYVSFNSVRKSYNLLDAEGYKSVHKQMFENAGATVPTFVTSPTAANTDWLNEILSDAIQTNYSVRISGASENVNYSLAANNVSEEGIVLGSDFGKKSLNLNLGFTKGKFSLNGGVTYAETIREGYKFSLRDTYHISPLIAINDANNASGYGFATDASLPDHANPLAINNFVEGETKLQYNLFNLSLGYEVLEGLNAKLNVSQATTNNYTFGFTKRFQAQRIVASTHEFGQVSEYNSQFKRTQTEALVTYKKEIENHAFDVLLGYSRIFEPFRETNAVADGYKTVDGNQVLADLIDPNFKTINAFGDGTRTSTGTNSEYALASQFARLNYSFKDRYLFQASVRRDGSSKFGANKRFGTFPAFALGWKISEESFMEDQDVFNSLKLRFSWGQAGNDSSLSYYGYSPLIEVGKDHYNGGYVFGGTATRGAITRDLNNPNLRWETNTSTNLGVDFAMLDRKLNGSVNYYSSLTSDLLFRKQVSPSAGINNPIVNIGEFKNSGIELELGYSDSVNEFKYNVNAAFSTTKNEVTSLSNADQEVAGVGLKYGSDHYVNSTRIGYEAGAYFLTEANGIFQNQAEITAHDPNGTLQPGAQPGDIRFVDQNGDNVLDSEDLIYSGTGLPKFEYSFNFNFEYKGFDATLFLQGVGGNKIYDGNAFEMQGLDAPRNFTANVLNAWTTSNTDTNMPRAILGDPNQNNRASTRFLHNGAYLRLKTVQLGYTLPTNILEKLKVDNLRVYVTGQNLFTATSYDGLDPEVGGSVLSQGIDRTLYPKYKSVIMGLQLKF